MEESIIESENKVENKVEIIVAHDYVLFKAPNYANDNKDLAMIQIPIQEARLLMIELLKEDYLQEQHTFKYSTYQSTEYIIRSKGWTKSKKL